MTPDELWRAFALMAVVEGVLYAIFPGHMKRMAELLLTQTEDNLRMAGLAAAFLGVGCLWWLRG